MFYKISKRVISILLVLIMIVGMIPINSSALQTNDSGKVISGTIISFNDASADITLTLTGESYSNVVTVKGNIVNYSFSGVTEGVYSLTISKNNHVTRTYDVSVSDSDVSLDVKIHPIGDINGDGQVNILDVNKANLYVKKYIGLDEYEMLCSDVNNDSVVDDSDVQALNRHYKNIETLWDVVSTEHVAFVTGIDVPASVILPGSIIKEYNDVKLSISDYRFDKNTKAIVISNIDLLSNGKTIDLSGNVNDITVKIPVGEYYDGQSVTVKHVSNNNEEIVADNVIVKDGYIEYTTKHFCKVVISFNSLKTEFSSDSISGIDRVVTCTIPNDIANLYWGSELKLQIEDYSYSSAENAIVIGKIDILSDGTAIDLSKNEQTINVKIPVDEKYNGQKVTVKHLSNGVEEPIVTEPISVEDGYISYETIHFGKVIISFVSVKNEVEATVETQTKEKTNEQGETEYVTTTTLTAVSQTETSTPDDGETGDGSDGEQGGETPDTPEETTPVVEKIAAAIVIESVSTEADSKETITAATLTTETHNAVSAATNDELKDAFVIEGTEGSDEPVPVAVGAIDLDLSVTTAKKDENGAVVEETKTEKTEGFSAKIETFITKGIDNMRLVYTGNSTLIFGKENPGTSVNNKDDVDTVGEYWYDPATGELVFMTDHFSKFVVGAPAVKAHGHKNDKVHPNATEAFDDVNGNDTVSLIDNINEDDIGDLEKEDSFNIEFDLNGKNAEFNVDDGSIVPKNMKNGQKIVIKDSSGKSEVKNSNNKNSSVVHISDGDVEIHSGIYHGRVVVGNGATGTLRIFGGTFHNFKVDRESDTATILIYGGTFDVDPSEYLADGYAAKKNADGSWTVYYAVQQEISPSIVNTIKVDSAPVIDGVLENTWGTYAIFADAIARATANGDVYIIPKDGTYLSRLKEHGATDADSWYYFAHDSENIYIAIVVNKEYSSNNDSFGLWDDGVDCVQLYLGLDDGDGDVYNDPHIGFGITADANCSKTVVNCFENSMPDTESLDICTNSISAAVGSIDGKTVYEIAIPVDECLGSSYVNNRDYFFFSSALFIEGSSLIYQVGQGVFWEGKAPTNSPMLRFPDADDYIVPDEPSDDGFDFEIPHTDRDDSLYANGGHINGLATEYNYQIPKINPANGAINFDGNVDLTKEWSNALCVTMDTSYDSTTSDEVTLWPPVVWTDGGFGLKSYDELPEEWRITINTYYLWDENGLYIASVCDDLGAYNGFYDMDEYIKYYEGVYGYSDSYSYNGYSSHIFEPQIYRGSADESNLGYHWPSFIIGTTEDGIDAWMDYDVTSSSNWETTGFTAEKGNLDKDHSIAKQIRSVSSLSPTEDANGHRQWDLEVFLPWDYINSMVDDNETWDDKSDDTLVKVSDLGQAGDTFRIGHIYAVRDAASNGSKTGIRIRMSNTQGWGHPDNYTLVDSYESGPATGGVVDPPNNPNPNPNPSYDFEIPHTDRDDSLYDNGGWIDGLATEYNYHIPKINPANGPINFDGNVDLTKEWSNALCVTMDASQDSTTYDEITMWTPCVWTGGIWGVDTFEDLPDEWKITINTYYLWDENGLYIASVCDDLGAYNGFYDVDDYLKEREGAYGYSDPYGYNGYYGHTFEPQIYRGSADESNLGYQWPYFFIGNTEEGIDGWMDYNVTSSSLWETTAFTAEKGNLDADHSIARRIRSVSSLSPTEDANGHRQWDLEIFLPWDYINSMVDNNETWDDKSDDTLVKVSDLGQAGDTFRIGQIYGVRDAASNGSKSGIRIRMSNTQGWGHPDNYTLVDSYESGPATGGVVVAKINNTSYTSLADAFAAAKPEDTVRVQTDILRGEPAKIPSDFGEGRLTLSLDNDASIKTESSIIPNNMASNQILRIMGTSGACVVCNDANGVFNVNNGGNIEIFRGSYYGEDSNAVIKSEKGLISVFDGNIIAKNGNLVSDSNGNYIGPAAIWISNGVVRVEGGNINGRIIIDKGATGFLNIVGGNFTNFEFHGNTDLIKIHGGTFDADPSAYVAEGYIATKNTDGTWNVGENSMVAKIGDVEYATLADAFAAAKANDRIDLISDITNDNKGEPAQISDDLGSEYYYKTIELLLNGMKIISNTSIFPDNMTDGETLYIYGYNSLAVINGDTPVLDVKNGGKLYLVAGTYYGGERNAVVKATNGLVVIDSGKFSAGSPKLTGTDGDDWAYTGSACLMVSDGKIVVYGGEFNGRILMDNNASGSLIINGGTFTDFSVQENRVPGTATIKIYGGTFDADPSQYLAEGYQAIKNSDNTWTVSVINPYGSDITEKVEPLDGAVAHLNSTEDAYYDYIIDAFSNSRPGDVVTLVSDINDEDLPYLLYLDEFRFGSGTLTWDLNGYSVNTTSNPPLPSLEAGKRLVIKDSVGTSIFNSSYIGAVLFKDGSKGEVVICGGKYIANNSATVMQSAGGKITVYDGAFVAVSDGTTDPSVITVNYGDIVVNGGIFTGKIVLNYNGKLTINGGTFNNFEVVSNDGNTATFNIYGGTFDADPSAYVADGYIATYWPNGVWRVTKDPGFEVPTTDRDDSLYANGGWIDGAKTLYNYNIPKIDPANGAINFDGNVDLTKEWSNALCVTMDASTDSTTYDEITMWTPCVWTNGGWGVNSYDDLPEEWKITINTYYLWDDDGLYIASTCDDLGAYNGLYDVSEYLKNRDGSYGYADPYDYTGYYGHSFEPMIYRGSADEASLGYHWPYFFIGNTDGGDGWMDYDITSASNWETTAFTAEKGNPDKDHSLAKRIRSVSSVSKKDENGLHQWDLEIFLPWDYINSSVDNNGTSNDYTDDTLVAVNDLGKLGDTFRIGHIYAVRDAASDGNTQGVRIRMSNTQGWGNPDNYILVDSQSGGLIDSPEEPSTKRDDALYEGTSKHSFVNGDATLYNYNIPKVNSENGPINFDGNVDLSKEWSNALCVTMDASEDSTTGNEITLWTPSIWSGTWGFDSFDELPDEWKITINTYYLWDDDGLYIASTCDDLGAYNGLYDVSEYLKNRDGSYGYADPYDYTGYYGHSFEPMIYRGSAEEADLGAHWPYFFIGNTDGGDGWMDYDITSASNWETTAFTAEKGNPDKDHSLAKRIRSVSSVSKKDENGLRQWDLEIFLPWDYINSSVDNNGTSNDYTDDTLVAVNDLGKLGDTFRIGHIYAVRDAASNGDKAGIRIRMSNTFAWGYPDIYTLVDSESGGVVSGGVLFENELQDVETSISNIRVVETEYSPVIDGLLDDFAWTSSSNHIYLDAVLRANNDANIHPKDGMYLGLLEANNTTDADSWYKFAMDDENLYISVVVNKEYESVANGSALWTDDVDCIQMVLGLIDNDDDPYNNPHIGFGINSNADCSETYVNVFEQSLPNAPDITVCSSYITASVNDVRGKTVYEIAIPLSCLGTVKNYYYFSSAYFFDGTYGYQTCPGVYWAQRDPDSCHKLIISDKPDEPIYSDSTVALVENVGYKTIAEAFAAVQSDQSVVLFKDINNDNKGEIAQISNNSDSSYSYRNFVLNLNGHNVSIDSSIFPDNMQEKDTLNVRGDESSVVTVGGFAPVFDVKNGGTLHIKGGTYIGGANNSVIKATNGIVKIDSGLYLAGSGNLVSTEGEEWAYIGSACIMVSDGRIIVYDGIFNGRILIDNAASGSLVINGGTFTDFSVQENRVPGTATIKIYGGTFDADPSQYLAEGYHAIKNSDNTWIVSIIYPYGADITEKVEPEEGTNAVANLRATNGQSFYTDSLSGAIACSLPGELVSLVLNIDDNNLTSFLYIDPLNFGSGTLTWDLNGYSIDTVNHPPVPEMYAGQRLVIKDSVGTSCITSDFVGAVIPMNSQKGELVICGGKYVATSAVTVLRASGGGQITVYGGAFVAPEDGANDSSVITINFGDIVVNGGIFTGKIVLNYDGKLTINGGTFNNFEVVSNDGNTATFNIYGGTFDADPSAYVADGYIATQNTDGLWVVGIDSGSSEEEENGGYVEGQRAQYSWSVPKVNPENTAVNFDGIVDLEDEWKGAQCVSIDLSEDSTTAHEVTIWPQGVWNGDFFVSSYEKMDSKWKMTINTYFLWDEEGLYIATRCDDCKVFRDYYTASDYIDYLTGRSSSYSGGLGFHFEPMIVCSDSPDAYVFDLGGHWPNFFMGAVSSDGTVTNGPVWYNGEVVSDSADPNPDALTQKIKHGQVLNGIADENGCYSFSQEIFLPWDYINQDVDGDGNVVTVGNVGTAGTTFTAGLIYSVRSSDDTQPRIKFSNASAWRNYDFYTLSAEVAK